MITDDQGTQILKKMDEQFTKVDDKFKEVNQRMDQLFESVNKRMDEQFRDVNKKLDNVIEMAVNSQHAIKNLVTREEFDEKLEKHQKENVEFKHAIVKRMEKLEDAQKDSARFQKRFSVKVGLHEKALRTHGLLPVEPVHA